MNHKHYYHMDNRYCVILAGGTGSNFWPLCRENKPKQFLDISAKGQSGVRVAYDRCAKVFAPENILVITLAKFKELVREQIPELDEKNLLLEPYGRKTAPCIVYSTYAILKRNPEAVITVTPSDIVISDNEKFAQTVDKAMDYAAEHPVLMTLGVTPTHPEPNFGYIQIKGGKGAYSEDHPMKVKTFTEKPDEALAKVFYESGEFLWNSGIFVWKASVIREEMERYIPEITQLFRGWEAALGTPTERVFLERAYADCTKQSIDYGVMEKTERAWLYPAKFGWADIGNWDALYSAYPKDASGNASDSAKSRMEDSQGNLIITGDKKKLVAVRGLSNCLVVDTGDVLMICPRDDGKHREFMDGFLRPGFEEYK